MAARLIHFGCDNCYRVQVLRSAGYEVSEPVSLHALGLALQQDKEVALVILSEDDSRSIESTVQMVREKCAAPIILFPRTQELQDESKFDRVFEWFAAPTIWLAEISELIAASHAILDEERELQIEALNFRHCT